MLLLNKNVCIHIYVYIELNVKLLNYVSAARRHVFGECLWISLVAILLFKLQFMQKDYISLFWRIEMINLRATANSYGRTSCKYGNENRDIKF